MSAIYLPLALRYRPQTFEDLSGQDVLVQTLRNAIRMDRIASAFVLTGIRGVGKTTTARIIAKTLNCTGGPSADKIPESPCNTCHSCVSITESRHPDILEMDAASRTGVDDVREIIEMTAYPPTTARYKVFIVDEVHMLSKSAFNALLKTLEEPPARVKFVFATTEIRKVPLTVLSRCQRFDLKRLTKLDIINRLKYVCKHEDREAEEGALALLAAAAEGSARDSLSLLDRSLSMQPGILTEDSVRSMLGMTSGSALTSLFFALIKGEAGETVRIARQALDEGAEPRQLLKDLQETVYEAALVCLAPDAAPSSASRSADEESAFREAAKRAGAGFLSRLWSMLTRASEEQAWTPCPQASLEMALLRACIAADLPSPEEAVKAMLAYKKKA